MLAYLVLLRVEIAAFHSGLNRLVSVALIRTSRWTGVTRYAALCSPDLPPVRPFGGCTSDGLVCFTVAIVPRGAEVGRDSIARAIRSLPPNMLHHIELCVADLERSLAFWLPFLQCLGYQESQRWPDGACYLAGKTYLCFVRAPQEYLGAGYHRQRIGLNHLAFHAVSRAQVDEV